MLQAQHTCQLDISRQTCLPHSHTWTTGQQHPGSSARFQHSVAFRRQCSHASRLSARRTTSRQATRTLSVAQQKPHHSDPAELPYGQPEVVAGIPVIGTDYTQQGRALWACLQQRPAEFVQLARQQLQDLARQHCNTGAVAADASQERLVQARQDAVREDVIYYWALAEAYLQDSVLHGHMRAALGRGGSRPLASGSDTMLLRSRVQLLEGHEGVYMIGVCRFEAEPAGAATGTSDGTASSAADQTAASSSAGTATADAASQDAGAASQHELHASESEAGTAQDGPERKSGPHTEGTQGKDASARTGASPSSSNTVPAITWGGAGSSADLDGPPPALEAVFASRIAKAAMALEGATPSRLNREGAARTYHMYCYWGYMNRRMARLRQQEEASGVAPTSGPYAFGDASGVQSSSYGSMTNVWRYFENVPDAITSLRTGVAAAVADRHLRALFGDQEECITTLLAWQQMCHEARWFGRALYDAEEFVLQSSLDPGL